MKPIAFILLAFTAACIGDAGNRNEIAGTYYTFSESTFSKAWDTLMIQPVHPEANTYLIVQKTCFQRIEDGELRLKEYKSDTMTGIWNAGAFQLEEQKHGRVYTWSKLSQTIQIGSKTYRKSGKTKELKR